MLTETQTHIDTNFITHLCLLGNRDWVQVIVHYSWRAETLRDKSEGCQQAQTKKIPELFKNLISSKKDSKRITFLTSVLSQNDLRNLEEMSLKNCANLIWTSVTSSSEISDWTMCRKKMPCVDFVQIHVMVAICLIFNKWERKSRIYSPPTFFLSASLIPVNFFLLLHNLWSYFTLKSCVLQSRSVHQPWSRTVYLKEKKAFLFYFILF